MLKIKVAKKGNTEEGKWFELPLEMTEEQYHNAGYVILDCESDEINGLKISYYDVIDDLNKLAERLEKVQDKTALEAIFEAIGYTKNESHLESINECLDIYENDSYSFYKNMSGVEIVEEMIEGIFSDLGKIPKIIRYHIDLQGIWNDLEPDGYTEVSNGIIRID